MEDMEDIDQLIKKEELLFDLECDFITDFIFIRKKLNLSQQALADRAGVLREAIARIENSITSPGLNTLIKILSSIGYTIKIVPIDKKKGE